MSSGYVGAGRLSSAKVVARQQDGTVLVQLPLPMLDVMVDVQAQVEEFATHCGLLLMQACLDSEVEFLAGERYKHDADRRGRRAGRTSGWAYCAGRKVALRRQRVRDEKGEVALSSVAAFRQDGRMQKGVAAKVLGGVKMRRYEGCLDAVCEGYGVKRSSVSRHWVRASARALIEPGNTNVVSVHRRIGRPVARTKPRNKSCRSRATWWASATASVSSSISDRPWLAN